MTNFGPHTIHRFVVGSISAIRNGRRRRGVVDGQFTFSVGLDGLMSDGSAGTEHRTEGFSSLCVLIFNHPQSSSLVVVALTGLWFDCSSLCVHRGRVGIEGISNWGRLNKLTEWLTDRSTVREIDLKAWRRISTNYQCWWLIDCWYCGIRWAENGNEGISKLTRIV